MPHVHCTAGCWRPSCPPRRRRSPSSSPPTAAASPCPPPPAPPQLRRCSARAAAPSGCAWAGAAAAAAAPPEARAAEGQGQGEQGAWRRRRCSSAARCWWRRCGTASRSCLATPPRPCPRCECCGGPWSLEYVFTQHSDWSQMKYKACAVHPALSQLCNGFSCSSDAYQLGRVLARTRKQSVIAGAAVQCSPRGLRAALLNLAQE